MSRCSKTLLTSVSSTLFMESPFSTSSFYKKINTPCLWIHDGIRQWMSIFGGKFVAKWLQISLERCSFTVECHFELRGLLIHLHYLYIYIIWGNLFDGVLICLTTISAEFYLKLRCFTLYSKNMSDIKKLEDPNCLSETNKNLPQVEQQQDKSQRRCLEQSSK